VGGGGGGGGLMRARLQREGKCSKGKAYVVAGSQSVHLNRVKASESKHALLSGYMGPGPGSSVGLSRVNAGRGDERINELMPAGKHTQEVVIINTDFRY
jgi:hypothetical protein